MSTLESTVVGYARYPAKPTARYPAKMMNTAARITAIAAHALVGWFWFIKVLH